MSEIWKDIEGYETLYQVSNEGRVRSLDRVNHIGAFVVGRIRKQRKNNFGYWCIGLTKNCKQKVFRVHRLVAFSFINNPNQEKYNVVDHINGIRNDNRVENLRWVNQRENIIDGFRRKDTTSQYEGVCWNKDRNKWVSQIMFNKHYSLGYFNNEKEAHKAYLKALEKGEVILEAEQIEKEKMKGVIYRKKLNSYYYNVVLSGSNFKTKIVKKFEEALFMKQEILKDFSNINKYRRKPYNLKEEFSKLDMNKLKKHKHFESFKHLI